LVKIKLKLLKIDICYYFSERSEPLAQPVWFAQTLTGTVSKTDKPRFYYVFGRNRSSVFRLAY
jgi:hypothetical protein